MLFEYDPERLIEEVKKRPGIWDFDYAEYRAKNTRHQLWKEIVNELMQPDVKITKSEMRELELQLQKKWKSIRDSFQKYIQNPNRTRRPYIYCKQLQFLFKSSPPSQVVDETQQADVGASSESDDTGKRTKKYHMWRYRKKFKLLKNDQSSEDDNANDNNDNDNLSDNNEESTDYGTNYDPNCVEVKLIKPTKPDEFAFANVESPQKNEVDDPDKLFLLSLLPHLKAIPEESRLNAKMELMQVLRNASFNVSRDQKMF